MIKSSYLHDSFFDFFSIANGFYDGVVNSIDSVSFAHFADGSNRAKYFFIVSWIYVQENIGGAHLHSSWLILLI